MRHLTTLAAALAALTLTIGCGDSGGGGSSGGPSAEEQAAVQKSDAGSDAADQTMNASTDAVLNAGSNGAVAAKGVSSPGAKTVASFNFQANVNVTIDLDDVDAEGKDRFPNATGQLNIVAAGSISGTQTSGSASYDVETSWLTEGVFTDPVSGVVAKMAPGSGIAYSLDVEWNWAGDLEWSISATSDLSGNHTVTVIDGGVTYVATASGSRHVDASIARTPSSFTVVYSVTGTRTVTVTNGVETHVVTVDVDGLDKITITVDGVAYGPYTAVQIRRWFGCHID